MLAQDVTIRGTDLTDAIIHRHGVGEFDCIAGLGSVRNFVGELGVTSTASGRGLEKITREHAD